MQIYIPEEAAAEWGPRFWWDWKSGKQMVLDESSPAGAEERKGISSSDLEEKLSMVGFPGTVSADLHKKLGTLEGGAGVSDPWPPGGSSDCWRAVINPKSIVERSGWRI